MTVEELIDELKRYPEGTEVAIKHDQIVLTVRGTQQAHLRADQIIALLVPGSQK